MRAAGIAGLLMTLAACAPDPNREAYLDAEADRQALEAQNRALELEARVIGAGRAYLIFDLDHREVRTRVSGVPLRSAGITWWTRRPRAQACCDAFQLVTPAEEIRQEGLPVAVAVDTLGPELPDSAQVAADSAAVDSAAQGQLAPPQPGVVPVPEGLPDARDDVAAIRLDLDGGLSLWLHGEYPQATRMDSLRTRGRTWLRLLPSIAATEDYHLFLPAHEVGWIQSVASESTWVLLLDCQSRVGSESRQMVEPEEEAPALQDPPKTDQPGPQPRAAAK